MFGDDHDFKFQMDLHSANHWDVTPEATLTTNSDDSLYDSRHGFADVALLASLNGFSQEVALVLAQEPVSEFIAQSEGMIQFDSQGEPQVQYASVDSAIVMDAISTSLETSPAEALAIFDQQDD